MNSENEIANPSLGSPIPGGKSVYRLLRHTTRNRPLNAPFAQSRRPHLAVPLHTGVLLVRAAIWYLQR